MLCCSERGPALFVSVSIRRNVLLFCISEQHGACITSEVPNHTPPNKVKPEKRIRDRPQHNKIMLLCIRLRLFFMRFGQAFWNKNSSTTFHNTTKKEQKVQWIGKHMYEPLNYLTCKITRRRKVDKKRSQKHICLTITETDR